MEFGVIMVSHVSLFTVMVMPCQHLPRRLFVTDICERCSDSCSPVLRACKGTDVTSHADVVALMSSWMY